MVAALGRDVDPLVDESVGVVRIDFDNFLIIGGCIRLPARAGVFRLVIERVILRIVFVVGLMIEGVNFRVVRFFVGRIVGGSRIDGGERHRTGQPGPGRFIVAGEITGQGGHQGVLLVWQGSNCDHRPAFLGKLHQLLLGAV